VVLTQGKVARLLAATSGVPGLVTRLLYGAGLRLMEGVRLRVRDSDVRTTMIYTHVLNRGGRGVASPLDRLVS
jgi:integrase